MVGHGGIVAFDERTDMRDVARHLLHFGAAESCGKCFPCRIGLRARARDVRRRRAGRPRAARGAARDARARQPVRARRRHAGADPQPARALPRGAGAARDHARRSTASEVERPARHDGARRRARRRRASPDALLRRAPGAVRRLPRVPGRRRGRARPGRLPARRPCRDGHGDRHRRTRPRAASRTAVVELVLSELPEPPGRAHRAGAGRRACSTSASRAGPATPHDRSRTTTRHPYLAFQHELCISCGRCVRACDEVQGTFALTATGRGFERQHRRRPRRGLPRLGLRVLRRVRRHLPDRRDHRDLAATLLEPNPRGEPCPTLRLDVTTTCGYCGVGCRLEAHARDGKVASISPALDGPANEGHTCLKGRFAHQFSRHRDRLTTPLIREDGELPARDVGGGDRPHRRRADADQGRRTARTRSPASPPRARPTRTATRCSA